MNHDPKKYDIPEEGPQIVAESVAAYAVPQQNSSPATQQHKEIYYNMAHTKTAKDIELLAKKVCINKESYKHHQQLGFYQTELPEQEEFISQEQLVVSLDRADAEGYLTDEETNHVMNLWQLVD